MENFAIITDTCSDLDKELREAYGVDYVPMHYAVDGQDYVADLDWQHRAPKEFYDGMRQGKRYITAQVNANSFREKFESYLSAGKDVLYVACSSKLSASVNAASVVAEELKKTYPDRKIYCLDSLRSCPGQGLLVLRAAELRKEGKTIDETYDWLEENKLTAHTEVTVDKLIYLKQAGRVSAASAFFGGLLNIKPIIIADALGRNFAAEKIKSRKASIARLVERMAERFENVPYQKVFISHADALEDAEILKAAVIEKFGDMDIRIVYAGPIIGASTGPGMLSVNYFGKEETANKTE